MSSPVRLAVLLSGRGSNMLELHGAIERGELPAEIVLVVSNLPHAPGLVRARELGLSALAIPHREAGSRAEHEKRVIEALEASRAQWICLAGYMRLLSAEFVSRFPLRIVNIHPSLLPAFPGAHAQLQALEHGVRFSGCTVHLVDAGLDSGPIVEQEVVAVLPGDTEESLSRRILAAEHRLYPLAVGKLLSRPWRLEGRRLIFESGPSL